MRKRQDDQRIFETVLILDRVADNKTFCWQIVLNVRVLIYMHTEFDQLPTCGEIKAGPMVLHIIINYSNRVIQNGIQLYVDTCIYICRIALYI